MGVGGNQRKHTLAAKTPAKAVRPESLGAVRPTRLEKKKLQEWGVPNEAPEGCRDGITQSLVGHDKDLGFYHTLKGSGGE